MCFKNSDRNLRNLETNSVALRIPKKADMKLLLVILVLIGFVSSGDPCKEGLDNSICTDGAKTGRLVARFQDADAGGCSPYSPFVMNKKYRCNDVSIFTQKVSFYNTASEARIIHFWLFLGTKNQLPYLLELEPGL